MIHAIIGIALDASSDGLKRQINAHSVRNASIKSKVNEDKISTKTLQRRRRILYKADRKSSKSCQDKEQRYHGKSWSRTHTWPIDANI